MTPACILNGCERNERNIHWQLGTKRGLCRRKYMTVFEDPPKWSTGFGSYIFYEESDQKHHMFSVNCNAFLEFFLSVE